MFMYVDVLEAQFMNCSCMLVSVSYTVQCSDLSVFIVQYCCPSSPFRFRSIKQIGYQRTYRSSVTATLPRYMLGTVQEDR
jgi:hypothetical protein